MEKREADIELGGFYEDMCDVCDCSGQPVTVTMDMVSWCVLIQALVFANEKSVDYDDCMLDNTISLIKDVRKQVKAGFDPKKVVIW